MGGIFFFGWRFSSGKCYTALCVCCFEYMCMHSMIVFSGNNFILAVYFVQPYTKIYHFDFRFHGSVVLQRFWLHSGCVYVSFFLFVSLSISISHTMGTNKKKYIRSDSSKTGQCMQFNGKRVCLNSLWLAFTQSEIERAAESETPVSKLWYWMKECECEPRL